MVYIGLGKGNIIEKNKARMAYVKQLSSDKKQVKVLVDQLINNMQSTDTNNVRISLEKLFYEEIPNSYIKETTTLFGKLDDISVFKTNMIEKCIKNPFGGFIWNCYDILVNDCYKAY